MAKTLVASPSSFLAAPLAPVPRHGLFGFPLYRPRRAETRVRMSLHEIPPLRGADSLVDLHGIITRVDGLLYTLADAAVAADASAPAVDASTAVQKSGGWFGFISEAMEVVLKVPSTLHAFVGSGFLYLLPFSGMALSLRERGNSMSN